MEVGEDLRQEAPEAWGSFDLACTIKEAQ